jgi:hypothetical protein
VFFPGSPLKAAVGLEKSNKLTLNAIMSPALPVSSSKILHQGWVLKKRRKKMQGNNIHILFPLSPELAQDLRGDISFCIKTVDFHILSTPESPSETSCQFLKPP